MPLRCGQREPLDRRDGERRVADRSSPIWAMTPPVRVSVPVRICGLPIARISNASPSGLFSTESSPGAPATTTPTTIRTPSTAIASAPALRSSLSRSSMPSPPMLPADGDRDPLPRHGREARPGADPGEVLGQLVDGRLAAIAAAARLASWRCRARAISSRSWSLPVVRLAMSWVSSVADRAGEARHARLPAELADRRGSRAAAATSVDAQPAAERGSADRRPPAHARDPRGRASRGVVTAAPPSAGLREPQPDRAGEGRQVDRRRARRRTGGCRTARSGPGRTATNDDGVQQPLVQVRRPDRRSPCTAARGRPS